SPELAAGTLQAHTLGVNDVGLAFLEAARSRGDRFGPLSWQHEVAHRLGHQRLITDAVLHYLMSDEQQLVMHSRFLELDRGTMPEPALADKVVDYARLHRDGEEVWRALYPAFPGLVVVLTGLDRAALQRRLAIVIALCNDHPALRGRHLGFPVHFALLEDLLVRGPFAPIFVSLEHDGPVDWMDRGPFAASASRGRP
ncbi:MAG: replication-relaxation family protein, partial [Candidatus Dormibacteraeota bacterium]|nr:replication-relaxation family protein [Candidatus Dormibacteraeota bacterium]